MPNLTPNYSFNLPLVNDPTDQDLWGNELNVNWSSIDTILNTRTQNYNFAGFQVIQPIFKRYGELVNALGNINGAVTVDLSLGNHVTCTLTDNVTFAFSNPIVTGNAAPIRFRIKQAAAGSKTVTWPASVIWPQAVAPTLTTTASRTDEFVLISDDGGVNYTASIRGQNYIL